MSGIRRIDRHRGHSRCLRCADDQSPGRGEPRQAPPAYSARGGRAVHDHRRPAHRRAARLRRPRAKPRRGPRARRRGRVAGRLGPRPHAGARAACARRWSATGRSPGTRIGMCLHVEAKTAVLVETLLAGGAEIAWTGSPATTDDGVAAAMTARANLRIYARKADDTAAHHEHIARVLASDPDMLLDNGADLIAGTVDGPRVARVRRDRGDDLGPPPPYRRAGRPRPVPGHRDQRLADQALVRERAGHRARHRRRVLPRHEHVRRGQDVRRRGLRLVRPQPRPDAARAGRGRARRGDRPGAGARGGLRGDARHRRSRRPPPARTPCITVTGPARRPAPRAPGAAQGRRDARQHGPLLHRDRHGGPARDRRPAPSRSTPTSRRSTSRTGAGSTSSPAARCSTSRRRPGTRSR